MTAFVLFFVILGMAIYFDVSDTTLAIAIAKENAIAALQNSQNYYFISDANFEVVSGNTLHIVIAIKPNSPALEADIKNEIETKIAPKIAGKTRFSSVLVQVNQ